eukprot:15464070-Alexandrium_andersonii.AAC.1
MRMRNTRAQLGNFWKQSHGPNRFGEASQTTPAGPTQDLLSLSPIQTLTLALAAAGCCDGT